MFAVAAAQDLAEATLDFLPAGDVLAEKLLRYFVLIE